MVTKLPYLMYIPDWQWNSGGVRTCHYLAHLLNEFGYPCALLGKRTYPEWKTPCLGGDQAAIDKWHDAGAIFIIPDMYEGYPYGARQRVLRYVCNRLGFFTGTKNLSYPEHELQVPFTRLLAKPGTPDSEILFLPCIDTNMFCPAARPRDQACAWVGKRAARFIDDSYGRTAPMGITLITKKTPKQRAKLAQLLKHSRVLYSFDDLTALVTEAGLCGCPSVIIPTPDYSRADYAASELGLDGIAWDTNKDELERAICTVHRCYGNYLAEMAKTELRVQQFITRTQAHYTQIPNTPREVLCSPS